MAWGDVNKVSVADDRPKEGFHQVQAGSCRASWGVTTKLHPAGMTARPSLVSELPAHLSPRSTFSPAVVTAFTTWRRGPVSFANYPDSRSSLPERILQSLGKQSHVPPGDISNHNSNYTPFREAKLERMALCQCAFAKACTRKGKS